jgi:hypothetical protein
LARSGQLELLPRFPCDLGQPEVEDFDDVLLAFLGQHQVERLNVAVHHFLVERVLKAQSRLLGIKAGVGHGQTALGFHQLGKVLSLDILHHQHHEITHLHRGVHLDDIGMVEHGRRLDLT